MALHSDGMTSDIPRTHSAMPVGTVSALRHDPGAHRTWPPMIHHLPHAVLIADTQGITYANPAAIRLFGQTAGGQAIGDWMERIQPRCRLSGSLMPIDEHPLFQALRGTSASRDMIIGHTRTADPISLRCVASPLLSHGRLAGAIAIHTDISDVDRSTDMLRRVNTDLEQFTTIVAHDLREPLRMIHCYLDLIQRCPGVAADANARRYLETASHSAARMRNLLAALLESTRVGRQDVQRTLFDSAPAVQESIVNLVSAVETSGASIVIGDMPEVYADRTMFMVAMQNLIGNGIKYARAGVPARIQIDGSRRVGDTLFTVRDNGIGIAPENQKVVFSAFHRLNQSQAPGTGLGLDICRKIISRHGGEIWVESEPDRGSLFSFTLPHPVASSALEERR